MNQRAQYLIQILDKIGAPLLSVAEGNADQADTATTVASLLGKVVEASIAMNDTLDLNATDAQDDSLRVALAAIAGSLVADQYKQKGKVPEAADLSRIQSALSAVLTFGDNFTLSDAHVARLENIKAKGAPVDAHQINIQYVDALIPVINAVSAFPFGQPEQKLIMDVSDRLVKRTAEMRETLLPGLSGDDEKLAELAILRATANVYAACHESETQRLTGSDEDAPATMSMDSVWQLFETRTAMLESVAKNIMPSSAVGGSSVTPAVAAPAVAAPVTSQPTEPAAPVEAAPEQAPQAPAESAPAKPAIFGGGQTETPSEVPPPVNNEVAPPAETQSTQASPAEFTPPTETPVAPATPAEVPPSGTSPMGFFAKPKDGESAEQVPDASISPPMAEAPPVVPPAAATPVEAPATPTPPPETPQAETTAQDSGDEGEGDKGGNPMSFFGKQD